MNRLSCLTAWRLSHTQFGFMLQVCLAWSNLVQCRMTCSEDSSWPQWSHVASSLIRMIARCFFRPLWPVRALIIADVDFFDVDRIAFDLFLSVEFMNILVCLAWGSSAHLFRRLPWSMSWMIAFREDLGSLSLSRVELFLAALFAPASATSLPTSPVWAGIQLIVLDVFHRVLHLEMGTEKFFREMRNFENLLFEKWEIYFSKINFSVRIEKKSWNWEWEWEFSVYFSMRNSKVSMRNLIRNWLQMFQIWCQVPGTFIVVCICMIIRRNNRLFNKLQSF